MTERRLVLVHSGERASPASPASRSRAEERAEAWAALRAALIGNACACSQDQIAIETALRELSRAAPSLASFSAPERAGTEPRSAQALWTLAVLVWGTNMLVLVGLIAAAAYLLGGNRV